MDQPASLHLHTLQSRNPAAGLDIRHFASRWPLINQLQIATKFKLQLIQMLIYHYVLNTGRNIIQYLGIEGDERGVCCGLGVIAPGGSEIKGWN